MIFNHDLIIFLNWIWGSHSSSPTSALHMTSAEVTRQKKYPVDHQY